MVNLTLMANNIALSTIVPTKIISGLKMIYLNEVCNVSFPLSTYEIPLFASVARGIRVSNKHPILANVISSCMTRSIIFECKTSYECIKLKWFLDNEKQTQFKTFQQIISQTSRHCIITDLTTRIVGNLMYVRFSFSTSEASGHNMTTIASNEIAKWIVNNTNFDIQYTSNSGNTCCDKKVSAVNSILGRGKNVIAETTISSESCKNILRTTPEKIVELNMQKNMLGSILAGSICSGNAHYANMLSAVFLPLGQDIANIVEGSQGITYCKVNEDGDLYFSVNLPNIICGVIGNGKNIDFVKENLKLIGCLDDDYKPITNASERMSAIIACIVLCGELSLMSALTNQDELVKSHIQLERKLV